MLLAPHAGLFWERVRNDYPTCKESAIILPQREDFSNPGAIQQEQFFQVNFFPRVMFEAESNEWVIQLQRDRFLSNWRLIADRKYPRYGEVSTTFFRRWEEFQSFVQENRLGSIEPTQYEITYLNQIDWRAGDDLGSIFPDFKWAKNHDFLKNPETITSTASFVSSDKKSRLRAGIGPGKHLEKGDVLMLELTVRGFDSECDIQTWFGRGREWIVKAFADLTSPEWHRKWGRIE